MANPTTNFGWQMPTSSDLVTDLPADFETFGQAVDTTLVDLKGGTTGQVLSKATNADMDFTWVTTDDANAIQNSIVDAKGDLIAASANDTPARLAVGNNGETLVADSSTATGLRYQSNFAAGKNKIINGDFGVWQRGTSLTITTTSEVYPSDRFVGFYYPNGGTIVASQQTFTPGTAPVAGYEGQYYLRHVSTSMGAGAYYDIVRQKIEDVRTFAGQTATLSFWAKASTAISVPSYISQNFGSGGSSGVDTVVGTLNIGTSWTRVSATVAVPSISGKTIGSSSYLMPFVRISGNVTVEIWGVQFEAGSVATAFQTSTGTIQGELAACQRYYQRFVAESSFGNIGQGFASSTTVAYLQVPLKTTMRVAPTVFDRSGTQVADYNAGYTTGTFAIYTNGTNSNIATVSYTHGSAALTQYRPYTLSGNGTTDYVGFGAEL